MSTQTLDHSAFVGVLLAGGQGRRMGGVDKCLLPLGGRALLQHVVGRAAPQVGRLLLNINGDEGRFAEYPLHIVRDVVGGHLGPLAGVLSAMEWFFSHSPSCRWLASFATDTPFFPVDLVEQLYSAAADDGNRLACAQSGGYSHPVFSLWSLELYAGLRQFLMDEKQCKMKDFFSRYSVSYVDFPIAKVDPFFNINTPEDLQKAEQLGFF